MDRLKKLTSLLLALVMVFAMTAMAFADAPAETPKTTITIDGGVAGSEYAAYKLLNATNAANEDGTGSGKYAYTLNDTYTAILQRVTGKTEQADIVAHISALGADGVRDFADAVYAAIVDANITADYTTNDNVFDEVEQGYYLIAETKVGNEADTYSLVMLDTKGIDAVTVKTKEGVPTVEKKVKDVNDSTGVESDWQDSADHDIGDTVEYQITGTVSEKYAEYESYYYSFEDKMVNGLTLNAESIKVTIGEVDVTDQFVIEATEHSFTATSNLKELTGVTVDANTKVIVNYTCTLNKDAVIGAEGNPNEVILKYENNPYHKADGDNNPKTPNKPEKPGETPKDVNIVFTYQVIVNKVDENEAPLTGAGFTLYKKNAEGEYVPIGSEVTGDALTTFEWKGLDDGEYKLEETTTPAGYNTIAPIEFTIAATHDEEAVEPELKTLVVNDAAGNLISGEAGSFVVEMTAGNIKTQVVNQTGTELPETGGMGTTMLYVVGGLLVVGAVVVMISKKKAEEK